MVPTLESKMIFFHRNKFIYSNVLFAGNLQDNLSIKLKTASSSIHTQQYHHWQEFNSYLGKRAVYSWVARYEDVQFCDTIIYFWPKNKLEAHFQLQNLLSLLPLGCTIFIVGENRSGVKSARNMLKSWVLLEKIDNRHHCILYYGQLNKQPIFNAHSFNRTYQVDQLTIHSLPGVFNCNNLDDGSKLLISTFKPHFNKKKILDVGSGSGVLGAVMAKRSPNVSIWLCDVNAAAVEASKSTLITNGIEGKVFASNIFSNINDRFDIIISNPPFHDGLQTNFNITNNLIRSSVKHLYKKGELIIVANSFILYSNIIKKTFGNCEIIAQNNRFKVYRAIRF